MDVGINKVSSYLDVVQQLLQLHCRISVQNMRISEFANLASDLKRYLINTSKLKIIIIQKRHDSPADGVT